PNYKEQSYRSIFKLRLGKKFPTFKDAQFLIMQLSVKVVFSQSASDLRPLKIESPPRYK
ncbi:23563_t:CDS:2, partial [Cetraspora pellucida]